MTEQKKHILFEDSAVREVLAHLKRKINYGWSNIRYVNKGRYAIIKGFGSPNIAILLKSEPFETFGRKFESFGEKGVGDSINVEALKEFVRSDVIWIYTLFRDGKLYHITLNSFLENSHKWQQKEGTFVRSISIHKYERVN